MGWEWQRTAVSAVSVGQPAPSLSADLTGSAGPSFLLSVVRVGSFCFLP